MVLDQSQTIHDYNFFTRPMSAFWHAQTFKVGLDGSLNKVVLWARAVDMGLPTNPDLVVEIRATSAGAPNSTILATETILWANIPSIDGGDSFDVVLSSPPQLEAGTTYAIVVYPSPMGTGADGVNIFLIFYANTSSYANGSKQDSSDDSSWTSSASDDLYFLTYVTQNDINVDIRTVSTHTVLRDINCDIRCLSYRELYDINCDIRVNSSVIFSDINCDIRVKVDPLKTYDISCDIRVSGAGDTGPIPVGLEGFRVYLDEAEITDVQIDSLQYEWTINETPATASFRIARKSDDFNETLDEISQAIINNTPIQIKFNDKLHWYGVISYIEVAQSEEYVIIHCLDRKNKIQEQLYNGSCGRKWEEDGSIVSGTYLSTGSFLSYILNSLVSSNIILSYSGNPGGIIQEYSETEGASAGNMITELLDLSGNFYWTVEPDGNLSILRSSKGTTKALPSQTITKQIHLYDILDYNIKLNDRSNLITSLRVEIGRNETITLDSWVSRTVYWYAKSYGLNRNVYQRINPTSQYIPGVNFDTLPTLLFWNGSSFASLGIKAGGYYWIPAINTFYTTTQTTTITSIGYGGVGATKQLKLTQLGVKPETWWNWYGNGTMWTTTRNGYNDMNYASDRAGLLVSRTKDPITEGSINLTFDAFEYYNIKLGDKINITSTNEIDIYNDNNGFPLDVVGITFNPKEYRVTLIVKHKTDYIATSSYR